MPNSPAVHNPVIRTARDQRRGTAAERGYGRRWQKVSKAFLVSIGYVCQITPGCPNPAILVDHIRPHRGNLNLFWDTNNWQGGCANCHNRKTARGE